MHRSSNWWLIVEIPITAYIPWRLCVERMEVHGPDCSMSIYYIANLLENFLEATIRCDNNLSGCNRLQELQFPNSWSIDTTYILKILSISELSISCLPHRSAFFKDSEWREDFRDYKAIWLPLQDHDMDSFKVYLFWGPVLFQELRILSNCNVKVMINPFYRFFSYSCLFLSAVFVLIVTQK